MVTIRVAGLAFLLLGGCAPCDPASGEEGCEVIFPPRDFVCADGEAGPCDTVVPALDDEARTVRLPEPFATPRTITFLISRVAVPRAVDGAAAGFDLDGIDARTPSEATCEHRSPDFVGSEDARHGGVDNALQMMISNVESLQPRSECPGEVPEGCFDAALQDHIDRGDDLVALEVSGVDDFTYDASVEVTVIDLDRPLGGFEGSGGVPTPGQSFTGTVLETATADIFEGRLRVALGELPGRGWLLERGTGPLPPLRRVEVRADIAEDGLTQGVIGGVMSVDDLAMDPPDGPSTVRGILEEVADVSPTPADPSICAALSAGFTFSAIPVTRLP